MIVPGETAVQGKWNVSPYGRAHSTNRRARFDITVRCVDDWWNLTNSSPIVTPKISSTTTGVVTDPYAIISPSSRKLADGTTTFNITLMIGNNSTFTASTTHQITVDDTDGEIPIYTSTTSPAITTVPGSKSKLQVLVPKQTAVPGSPTGWTGNINATAEVHLL